MRKLWYLCSDLCDMPWTACRQTMNKFSVRWSLHRSTWNKPDSKSDKHQTALLWHNLKSHGTVNKSSLLEANTVTFVEQPYFNSGGICEDICFFNLTHKLVLSTWSSPMWNNACDFLRWILWRDLTFLPPSMSTLLLAAVTAFEPNVVSRAVVLNLFSTTPPLSNFHLFHPPWV